VSCATVVTVLYVSCMHVCVCACMKWHVWNVYTCIKLLSWENTFGASFTHFAIVVILLLLHC